MKIKGEKSWF